MHSLTAFLQCWAAASWPVSLSAPRQCLSHNSVSLALSLLNLHQLPNGSSPFLKTQFPVSRNVYSLLLIWSRCLRLSPLLASRRFLYFSLQMEINPGAWDDHLSMSLFSWAINKMVWGLFWLIGLWTWCWWGFPLPTGVLWLVITNLLCSLMGLLGWFCSNWGRGSVSQNFPV